MSKERFHYIDVAKGFLILMVTYCHACLAMKFVNHPFTECIQISKYAFAPYIMPAFFVITGYCSNFKKPFPEFLKASFKTIVIPNISFTLLYLVIGCNFEWIPIWKSLESIILFGGGFWFLSCLFIGRLMYYGVNRFFTGKRMALICALCFVVGYAINPFPLEYEFWWFAHALILMPFMWVGQYLRNRDLSFFNHYILLSLACVLILSATVFFAHIGLLQMNDYHVPMIVKQTRELNVTMFLPLILIYLLGTFMVLSVSKKINSNSVLEYLGRNSLIVYCAQAGVLRLIYPRIGRLISPSDTSITYLIIFGIGFILTVAICSFIAYIMNRRYIKVLIGKF